MQTAGPFGRSSSAVKLRPRAGRMPSVGREAGADALAVQLLGIAVAGQREVVERRDADRRERLRVIADAPRSAATTRAGALKLSCGLFAQIATSDDGLRHRDRVEHQPVVDGEQRRVGADADGDREDRDEREAGTLLQGADGGAKIGHGWVSWSIVHARRKKKPRRSQRPRRQQFGWRSDGEAPAVAGSVVTGRGTRPSRN